MECETLNAWPILVVTALVGGVLGFLLGATYEWHRIWKALNGRPRVKL